MGVPGFFSWLLRNYKKNDIIIDNLKVKIKTLYIDANCLFHPQCFKILENFPALDDIEKLETYMMRRITNYISFLVNYVNPDQVYISVDGVAPLAKIAQQRKRRFQSIKDSEIRESIKIKHGIASGNSIWSNIKITPGTVFMEKLHNYIIKYIKTKETEKPEISYIYSSYHEPGEGEHKILYHIRNFVAEENIVIYGLDADLFFLAMASQKKNIYLLREASQFDNKTSSYALYDPIDDVAEKLKYVSIDETKRCYNEQIMSILDKKNILDKELKPVCFINDFIFLCYLLGNDFLPHLPSIDIKKNGLDFLIDGYTDIYLILETSLIYYESEDIKINNIFFEEILKYCALRESYYFSKILRDAHERFIKKRCPVSDAYKKEIWELENLRNIDIIDDVMLGTGDIREQKERYYKKYVTDTSKKNINKLCQNYIQGLYWVLEYYFKQVPEWRWQYKYTHAPFISDVYHYYKNLKTYDFRFKKDTPLDPCVQLLSVLPPKCHRELPIDYQKLIINEDSPIKDMFPEEYEIDYLYKEQLWQCIPMIPFLDIGRIITETKKCKLTSQEKIRNKIIKLI